MRGGYNPKARETRQEALPIPAVEVSVCGRLRGDVWNLIVANVRLPIVVDDVRAPRPAREPSGDTGLPAVIDRYGFHAVIAHRARISSTPPAR